MIKTEFVNTKGIILKNSRLKDTSASITVLTPDLGIIECTKFGYNSKKNDCRSALQILNLTDLYIGMKKNGGTVKECVLENDYAELKKDYRKTVCASELASSVIKLNIYEIRDYSLIFILFQRYMETLCKKESDFLTLTAYFYYQLAWCLGISFTFIGTAEGGNKYFRYSDGTIISSPSVGSADGYRISSGLYMKLREFSEVKFADAAKLDYITEKEFHEFCDMYTKYTGYHLGTPLVISRTMTMEI